MYPLLPQLIERAERHGSWRSTHPEIDYPPLVDLVAEQARTFSAHRIGPGCGVLVDDSSCCARLCAMLALWSIGAQVVTTVDCAPSEASRRCGAQYRLSFGVVTQPHLFGTEVIVCPIGHAMMSRSHLVGERDWKTLPRTQPWIRLHRDGRCESVPMTACLFVPAPRKPLPTVVMGVHR